MTPSSLKKSIVEAEKTERRIKFCKDYYGEINDILLKLVMEIEAGAPVYDDYEEKDQWKKDIEPVEEMIKLGLHLDQVVKTTPITPTQAMKMTDVPDELYEQPEGKLKIEVEDVTEVLNELEDLT